MKVWYEGSVQVDCDLETVKAAVGDPGEFFVGVVAAMPGMSEVSLVDQADDVVSIHTNEGTMRRSNISCEVQTDKVTIEFDEEYDAGRVKAHSHFCDEYTASNEGVVFRTTVGDVRAPGLLGALYRRFGSRNMGKAFLSAHKDHLESRQPR